MMIAESVEVRKIQHIAEKSMAANESGHSIAGVAAVRIELRCSLRRQPWQARCPGLLRRRAGSGSDEIAIHEKIEVSRARYLNPCLGAISLCIH